MPDIVCLRSRAVSTRHGCLLALATCAVVASCSDSDIAASVIPTPVRPPRCVQARRERQDRFCNALARSRHPVGDPPFVLTFMVNLRRPMTRLDDLVCLAGACWWSTTGTPYSRTFWCSLVASRCSCAGLPDDCAAPAAAGYTFGSNTAHARLGCFRAAHSRPTTLACSPHRVAGCLLPARPMAR